MTTASFLSAVLAPFGLVIFLLIARPFLIAAQHLPDCRLKRFLLFRYNEGSAWRALLRREKSGRG